MNAEDLAMGLVNKLADSQMMEDDKNDGDHAKKMLEKADCQELYKLYQKALKEKHEMAIAVKVITEHYAASSNSPRHHENDVIKSMEIVATKAIDLAQIVIASKNPQRTNDGKFRKK